MWNYTYQNIVWNSEIGRTVRNKELETFEFNFSGCWSDVFLFHVGHHRESPNKKRKNHTQHTKNEEKKKRIKN